jgi:hypothetical protein
MMLATAAAVPGEDIDLKVQRVFAKGINCEVTGPKLRKALKKPDCTFSRLVKVAELTESRNLLKREDPVITKYISDVSQGTAPVSAMGMEAGEGPQGPRMEVSNHGPPASDNGRWADATCYKCGQLGHIRPYCPSTGPDMRLDPSAVRRRNADNSNRGGGGGQRGRCNQNNRPVNNPGGWNNGPRQDNTVPSRRVALVPAVSGIGCQLDAAEVAGAPAYVECTMTDGVGLVTGRKVVTGFDTKCYPVPEDLLMTRSQIEKSREAALLEQVKEVCLCGAQE